ncbi:MAG: lipid-A-disaccharide synthase [Candidatus Neomarinimicrobiota bacterium]|nr:lipid-A-disaccharide synthase [Candidatus Neomarinimicrobiota bacterium]
MSQSSPIFFMVAGEQSGDLHGSKLIQSIKKLNPNSTFIGHGGDRMQSCGLEIMHHVNELAIMGFTEVLKHLPFMINVMGESLEKIKEIKPDRIILIDYPGFNLRLSKNCRPHGVPITYFILPQLWAWKENRIKYFHRYVDQSLSIFPFEQEWFERREVPTNYVGHPFNEGLEPKLSKAEFFNKHGITNEDTLLALIPGSRQQEIDRHLMLYYRAAQALKNKIKNLKIIITKADNVIFNLPNDVIIEPDDIYGAMKYSKAAITTSGTASLECAIMDTPEVVCYKLSGMSYLITNLMNKSPFISMVNLIAGRMVVPEYLQNQVNQKNIVDALLPLLNDTAERKKMLEGMSEVRRSLGMPGAYDRAAEAILQRT